MEFKISGWRLINTPKMALNNNRDFKRNNKSDDTLHANILSLISSESIAKVKIGMKRKFDEVTEEDYKKTDRIIKFST